MYRIEVDLDQQCGECEEYHYVIYKWNGKFWENVYSDSAKTPEQSFSDGLLKYNRIRTIQNEP